VSAFDVLDKSPAESVGERVVPPVLSSVSKVSDECIVAYKTTDEPVYFKEDTWDLNLYKPVTSSVDYFFYFERFEQPFRDEMKQLCLLWLQHDARNVSSIKACMPTCFTPFYTFAKNHNISIASALSDEQWISDFVTSASELAPKTLEKFIAIIKRLRRFRLRGYCDFGPESDKLEVALAGCGKHPEGENQTSVIPSRIYCNLIAGLSDILKDFVENNIAEKVIALYARIDSLPSSGGRLGKLHILSKNKTRPRKYKHPKTLESMMADLGLDSWLMKYGMKVNLLGLQAMVGATQLAAKIWIHLFTGMRHMEVNSLPYQCLSTIESRGKDITVIHGRTSKLTGAGVIPTLWITNDIVKVAVTAAQGLSRYFAAYHGLTVNEDVMYLFPRMGNIGKIKSIEDFEPEGMVQPEPLNKLLALIPGLIIEEEDVAELLQFQSFTPDFRTKFKVGEIWPLTTHQCRRSLAVYTARSNRVSIGAMTAQFKHLTLQMQEYYRRGSLWAKDLLASDAQNEYRKGNKSMVDLIELEERTKQYDDFEERVINEAGPLAGGAGSTFKRTKRSGEFAIIGEDREQTKRSFIEGRLAFKESPIGWCTKLDACDKIIITNDTQCVGCENSVFTQRDIPKMERHIVYLQEVKQPYSKGSMFERHYAQQIDLMEKTIEKVKGV
jgi:hypothetical protein